MFTTGILARQIVTNVNLDTTGTANHGTSPCQYNTMIDQQNLKAGDVIAVRNGRKFGAYHMPQK